MGKNILSDVVTWSRLNSPWAIHFNAGSCNGCDIELLSVLTPCHDVERLGIKLQGSPRHADVLIATGAVTRQSRDRLLRIYDQMPGPKFVIALGSCGISGGVFNFCGNIASIVTPLAIGYIINTTGSFNGALMYVGCLGLLGAFSYLFIAYLT